METPEVNEELTEKAVEPAVLTPMIRQYQEIKARNRDKILFFRVGDFYEMFFEDAKEAAGLLQITLTARGDIPLAGVPYHAANHYIYKLIAAGKKVAICEQMEDPSQAKGIVRRDIVSVITPGTLMDDNYIDTARNNYLCAIYGEKEDFALAFVDNSTGDFFVVTSRASAAEHTRVLQDELARFSPSEIIFNDKIKDNRLYQLEIEKTGVLKAGFPEWYFEDDFITLSGGKQVLDFPAEIKKDKLIYKAVLGSLHYLYETQGLASPDFFKNCASLVSRIRILSRNSVVEMDDFTIRNLELLKNMQDGSKKFTLLDVMDQAKTPMGGRLLRRFIVMPLSDRLQINERLNSVEVFFDDSILTGKVRDIFARMSDIERLNTRIALRKTIPRDLPALSKSIKEAREIGKLLGVLEELKPIADGIKDLAELTELIDRAVEDEPSTTFNGEVIRDGYHTELDRLKKIIREGKNFILELQNREKQATGIASLKIKYNNVLGYFIEVSKANTDKVPGHYVRKQSLVSAERYTLPELSDYELQIESAGERIAKLEEELFMEVVEVAAKYTDELSKMASVIALADVYSAFALIARENHFVKPEILEDGEFRIVEGRHPVVEKHIGHNLFVPNDTVLDNDENRILIITGPNMAGKSTFLRQNALIAIMAQMGSYVPARKAQLGIVDKIFTRIGASDNLSQGQSTFLVEMQEAANILRNSTEKSLIIMDELGRGTSTYDGLSIAWAVVEYLHEHKEKGGKTLFATHYHELTKLGEKKGIQNYNIAVREYEDELVFLRKVISGPADRSYGIYVAKLAGIPLEITERANLILETLEKEGNAARKRIETIFDRDFRKSRQVLKNPSTIELFPDNPDQAALDRLRNIDINRITPIEAITFLAEIKKQLKIEG